MMRTKAIATAALVAALAAMPFAVSAWQASSWAPVSLAEGSRVRIPFAPPLGTTLRYLLVHDEPRGGRAVRTEFGLLVRFERVSEGYRMVTTLQAPGTAAFRANPVIQITERPIAFRLDREGAIVGIDEEAQYWAGIDEVFDRLLAGPMKNDVTATRMFRGTLEHMKQLPLPERLELVGRNVKPLVSFAGADIRVGATIPLGDEEAAVPLPMLKDQSLTRTTRITLRGVTGDVATFETVSTVDAGDLNKMVGELSKMRAKKSPGETERDGMETLRQSIIDEVSVQTGLTHRHKEVTVAEALEKGRPVRITRTRQLYRL